MHRRLILAPTPRERERWHAIWLLAQGWTASAIAEALERDPHTTGLDFRAVRARPPSEAQQASLRAPVKEPPARSGIELANWNWKVVRRFVLERFGISLSRSGCLNYLHRLGFVLKRLVKFDEPSCPGTNGDAMHARLKQPHSTGDDKSPRDVGEPERR